jgi:hypothetical protein
LQRRAGNNTKKLVSQNTFSIDATVPEKVPWILVALLEKFPPHWQQSDHSDAGKIASITKR